MKRKTWGDFYSGAGGVDYFLRHLDIHRDFIAEILSHKPKRMLEAGCGSAIMSTFFSMAGYAVTACDRDTEVLEKAAQISQSWNGHVTFAKEDLLHLSFQPDEFDLSFSQGVLEHMDDESIRKTVTSLLKISRVFVFSVPSHYYRHKDFGDERLMTRQQWQNILRGVGRCEIRYYYDERVKRNFLLKKPLMLMGIVSR